MSLIDNQDELKELLLQGEQPAFFFTEQGIITELKSSNALFPLLQTAEKLQFKIETAHHDREILVVKGSSVLDETVLHSMGYTLCPVRVFLNQSVNEIQAKILRAYHWLNWDSHTRFCGRCGLPLIGAFNVLEKRCNQCDLTLFPKASPAVMVLLHRGDELLLARSPHFQPGVYSAIAGFVEIGESAEEAAKREVNEELGLTITGLQYFASQTWPFPDSFMMAFTSEAPEGDLVIDTSELEDARWFSINDLPNLPSQASISRKLIESLIKRSR
ncbi:NAD(+) diphosphatase [Candidatus Berkiella aquae]|uniref:NAD(+) diphosphatase n=1 Tax=Candidatus Berkiella aquae TaxID=295108 RepID=A0A0Q9YVB0_9GAMM|nr:NAD(+) diphosphatase [Candidatus Berkiella aquae]MCS5710191.1 NAD(+) diphosphatase [Candidatus Berkiella aquae]